MIRRNPTLIPMGDLDVQDVRDMVSKQKTDAYTHQKTKMKRMAEKGLEDEDVLMLLHLKDVVNARRGEDKDKQARLGLPQVSQSAGESSSN